GIEVGFGAGDAGAGEVFVHAVAGGDKTSDQIERGRLIGRIVVEDQIIIVQIEGAAGGDIQATCVDNGDAAVGVIGIVAEGGAGGGEDDFGSGRDIDGSKIELLDAGA